MEIICRESLSRAFEIARENGTRNLDVLSTAHKKCRHTVPRTCEAFKRAHMATAWARILPFW